MSFIFNYVNYYIYGTDNEVKENKTNNEIKKFLISVEDLAKVNLTPVDNVIPAPARNMPPKYDKINLQALNKAQLQEILNVKLKPTKRKETILFFEPRHPVINELYHKFKNKNFC
jgi:hypothetical protein